MDLDLIATMLQTMYNVTHLYFYNLSISLLFTSMDLILMATVLQTMYGHIFINGGFFYWAALKMTKCQTLRKF